MAAFNLTYLERLADEVRREGLDAILVAPSEDLLFITGHSPLFCERFQGLFVKDVDQPPKGYTLMRFPGGNYLVVTTEWMETNEEAVGPAGNGRCNQYAGTAAPPAGWARADGPESLIFRIEKENARTPQGSRYEVWVPIQKAAPQE